MNTIQKKEKRSIFLANFDWRDIYHEEGQIELMEKLERDRFEPKRNDFFIFSWGKKKYRVLEGQYKTVHRRTFGMEKIRPLLDKVSLFSIPYTAWKYRVRPDAWMTYDFGLVPALWIAKKLFGGKLILVLNNQPHIYSQTRKFGKVKGMYSWVMERISRHLIDHFFTINETLKKYIMDLNIPSKDITIFSMNTIDRDLRFISEAKKGVIRKKYNLPEGTKILLTVARLEAEKNYPKLLEMFSGLDSTHVLFALGMGSLRPLLEARAKELGIEDRVYFEGYVPRDKIWDYFTDAQVFVLLSKAEALGIVLWEAIVSNTPIVCSDVEGMLETVGSDGERGRVWKEDMGQAGFNERIRFCIEESKEKEEMLKRARAFVDEQRKNQVTVNSLPIWDK